MPDTRVTPSPPQAQSTTGHPLPRRSSPENSVTLKHHRLARDASLRASAGSAPADNTNTTSSPRRNSSGESQNTSQSDPKKWFDQSNQNPAANFDSNAMDVDPPFFQRQSESSGEEKQYNMPHQAIPPRLAARSSSNDDYRSVIDDLTVEIQKLKEELKRYKQKGPDMLRKDKLFEIKIHGLPKRKRRELESTLRDFASSLDGSPNTSSSRQKGLRASHRDRMYSNSGSMSKHASSSSGSNARPADSAYASMSTTGIHSSGTSLGRPSISSRAKSSEQKVENYLRDIPEGLYPRHMVMTDKEKKKLVVRRLEQLFTGKISGRHFRRNRPQPPPSGTPDGQMVTTHAPPSNLQQIAAMTSNEAAREARMLPPDQQTKHGKKSRSRDNASASNSNGDQTESGNNGNSASGGDKGSSGTNTSPPMPPPPEQRPTRPKDLDPDRVQVPSENMDYIKHLGLVPPGLLADSNSSQGNVHTDADGWVYLNLLCNLAQLHIINVTPDFVRSAVSGMSTKFQLSADGRKIRWRGGTEGTRFNSDSSGNNSQRSPAETEDTENSNENKRRKTGHSNGDDLQSGSSSKDASKFGHHVSTSSDSFHYKPLFVHQESNEQSSLEDTQSSFGPVDDSAVGDSRWGQSGSGTSNRRKRRHDGAIIYYSGAPFCTDLSGDPGYSSPTTYMLSSNQESQYTRPVLRRSESGSSLDYRPLSDRKPFDNRDSKMDIDGEQLPDLTADSGDESSDFELDIPWSTEPQYLDVHHLEPCGLGGILPDDHFMVVVTTKRPKEESIAPSTATGQKSTAEETTDNIITRLASMSTSSPAALPSSRSSSPAVEIEYVSGRIKRLTPVALPAPAIFVPPFSTDDSSLDETSYESEDPDDDDEDSEMSSNEFTSRKANRHQSNDYPDGVELTSGDEDGEEPENEPDTLQMYDGDVGDDQLRRRQSSAEAAAGTSARGRSKSASAEPNIRTGGGSSVATAGGVPSDISSDDDMSS